LLNGIHGMADDKVLERNNGRHLDRLLLLPVFLAIVLIWAGLAEFTLVQRTSSLDRTASQLGITVSTLADINELAEGSGTSAIQASSNRRAAFWRALLQYPSASFWVESHGRIVAGERPTGVAGPAILAQDVRAAATVHASLPEADALAEWRRASWERVAAVVAVSLAFLILTHFLTGALRKRTSAEREATASAERARQLALYRTELQETVARRTEELAQANTDLEIQLVERRSAEVALRQHDALLRAVTKSAAELLGSHSLETPVTSVLELIGNTLFVSRVHLTEIVAGDDGHFRSLLRNEWCAPDISPLLNDPEFQNLDLTASFPKLMDRLFAGERSPYQVDEIALPLRSLCESAEMRSILHIPIHVQGALWGSLNFIDSARTGRHCSWAETDTLNTLAGLIGSAIRSAQYVKELADANTIVQNSPTILYRLRGEKGFPLMYISENVGKFGHDPLTLMRSADWTQQLVDPRDQATVDAAMAGMLEQGAAGSSIEFRLRTGAGTELWVENRYSPRRKDGRLLEIEGIIIDINERKIAEQEIALLARTDSLTGLANRATFLERLRREFAAATRGSKPFAILYLDLDRFKPVNDTLGHAAGDDLLREVARRLTSCVRGTDLVARLGGDEFAVLQTDVAEPASAGVLAAKIQESLAQPYRLNGTRVEISVSIGISPYSPNSTGPETILGQADLALYRSKEEGRNRYRFHSETLDREVRERVTLSEDLKAALEDGKLEIYCEPQVALSTADFSGLKALVRWYHPSRGLLTSRELLPMVEKTGGGMAFGRFLLDGACRELHQRRIIGSPPQVVAIEARPCQLRNADEFICDVRAALARWELLPSDLELDVTEATFAQLTLASNDTLHRACKLGVKIALADVGTECSTFEYLRAYHVAHIKISDSLISDAPPDRAATIHAALRIAQELGIDIITEGHATEEQHALVVEQPCMIASASFAPETQSLL
jgi:diguanylate cyclase (GGDEF)-like protein/PAS domain S-box-containing protein